MLTRLPLIAAIGAVLLLTACGPATPSPTEGGTTAPAPSAAATPTTAPPPAPTPTPSSSAAATFPTGTCTQADMPTVDPFPTIYSIYSDQSDGTVTFHYMGFNRNGTNPIFTETTTAFVTTIIAWPCTDNAGGALWTLTATAPHSESFVGCLLSYGGWIQSSKTQGGEDPRPYSVDCSSNPGM